MLDPASGLLWYLNAGHHPPVVLRANGTHESLRVTGPAVGIFEEARHTVEAHRLDPGDVLLGYTDGLVEARSAAGASYGAPRALATARAAAHSSAKRLLDHLETAFERHLGVAAPQHDLTLLALRRLPSA